MIAATGWGCGASPIRLPQPNTHCICRRLDLQSVIVGRAASHRNCLDGHLASSGQAVGDLEMDDVDRAMAVGHRCLIALSFFMTLLVWTTIPIPADAAHCGGNGQRACCVTEHIFSVGLDGGCTGNLVEGPPNPAGCAFGTCQAEDSAGFPVGCGGTNEVPCLLVYHIPSCKSGLVEAFAENRCVAKDSDGFPTVCGDSGERACLVVEHIPSCKPFVIELTSGCSALSCGSEGQRPCLLVEHIPSCRPGLVEVFKENLCVAIDSDGFPSVCGDGGERACTIVEHIPSCKPSAREVTTSAGLLVPGWCVDRESFLTQLSTWDEMEAAPGPRTIFLIHGLGSDRRTWGINASSLIRRLDDPEFDFNVYVVDYNGSVEKKNGVEIEVPFRIFALNAARNGLEEVYRAGGRLDGFTFSLPLVSRLIKEAMLALPDVKPNVAIVAHSMGGIIARDLVFHHYDDLRNKGFRIADVITVASPHRGGGAGIPEILDAQTEFACLGGAFLGRADLHQACLLETWHEKLLVERRSRNANGAPFIDNLDFPQVRWVSLASADRQTSGFDLSFIPPVVIAPNDFLVRNDDTVGHVSAFGIATDLCFPHVDLEPPPFAVSGRAGTLANIGESSAWIEHFWPPQVQNGLQIGFGFNPFNGFDVSPAALQTDVNNDGDGSLNAACHSPGPSSDFPNILYLSNEAGRYKAIEDHGKELERPPFKNYIKTVLTDGLRSLDVDGNGLVDGADLNRLIAGINATARSNNFDVAADLNGDGFINQLDLDLFPDTTPPQLTLPPSITVEAAGPDGVTVLFSASATDNVDPSPMVSCTPSSGSTFLLGTTTVDCTATDAIGNSSNGSFAVTIEDTTPPTITPPAALTAEANSPGGATGVGLGLATASDIVDPAPAVTNDAPATFPLGATTVTWTATDASGNVANATQTVTVVDTTPPVVTTPPDLVVTVTGALTAVNLEAGGAASATDAVGVVSGPTPDNSGPFTPGVHVVTWTAADGAGNEGSATQSVSVLYDFVGFLTPVDNLPLVNTTKAGRGIPIKWQLRDGNAGFIGDLGAVAATQFVEVSCNAENLAENPVEAGTTGQSGTRFDEAEQKFIHVWDTSRTLGGRCADFLLGLNDGSQHRARFAFR